MKSPYDIEEMYPDDATGSVRLPRRQAGSAPQEMAVTLLADYTLRTRAWLPSAAIVALLAEAGVSQAGARTAISRLARRGILEGSRQGRHSSYRLTEAAAIHLSIGGSWIVSAMAQRALGRMVDTDRLLASAAGRHAAAKPAQPPTVARIRAALRRPVDLAA